MKFPSRHTLYGLSSSVSGCNHILTISHHQQPPSAITHHPQPSLFSADSHRHIIHEHRQSSPTAIHHLPHPPSVLTRNHHRSSPTTVINPHPQSPQPSVITRSRVSVRSGYLYLGTIGLVPPAAAAPSHCSLEGVQLFQLSFFIIVT